MANETALENYESAMANFRTASRAYDVAARKYRACEIDDATFLVARAALDGASGAVDAAETLLPPLPRLSSWNEGD